MHRLIPFSARVTAIAGSVLAAGAGTALACMPNLPTAVFTHHSSDQVRTVIRTCDGGRTPTAVRPGDCLAIAASGFEPKEAIDARLLSLPTRFTRLTADKVGSVTWRYTVAKGMSGKEVVTFVGQGAAHQRGATSGNVAVTVPRFAVARYTVSGRPREASGRPGGNDNSNDSVGHGD